MNRRTTTTGASAADAQVLARHGLTASPRKEAMTNSVRIDAAAQPGQERAWIAFDVEELRELFHRCLHSLEEDNSASKDALMKLALAVDRLDLSERPLRPSPITAEAI